MSADAVRGWLEALRRDHLDAPDVGLSPAGRGLVLVDALDALEPEHLDPALALPGEPWSDAVFVAARTVSTAPLEWLALLLGRGTRVTLKHPHDHPGLAPWLGHHADVVGLPLSITSERSAITRHQLVIAMGSDPSMEGVLADARAERVLAFGDRFSVAWWPRGTALEHADDLARALAAHDGRGCLTPALVLTDDDADVVHETLADAMARAELAWPRGRCAPAELAALRARDALARVVGRLTDGGAWKVHTLPPDHASPRALPRAAQVVPVADDAQARALLDRAWSRLSTVATPTGTAPPWPLAPDQRFDAWRGVQAPPLWRRHDGVDVVRATLRSAPGAA